MEILHALGAFNGGLLLIDARRSDATGISTVGRSGALREQSHGKEEQERKKGDFHGWTGSGEFLDGDVAETDFSFAVAMDLESDKAFL